MHDAQSTHPECAALFDPLSACGAKRVKKYPFFYQHLIPTGIVSTIFYQYFIHTALI
jgi:hypothetical protein